MAEIGHRFRPLTLISKFICSGTSMINRLSAYLRQVMSTITEVPGMLRVVRRAGSVPSECTTRDLHSLCNYLDYSAWVALSPTFKSIQICVYYPMK